MSYHNGHLVDHITNHQLVNDNTLYVVGVCSNPSRWHSRYRIAREWIAHMLSMPNIHLTIVEAAIGDRHHELSPPEGCEYDHIKIRVNHETWIKESLANKGHQHDIIKYDAQYLALFDMDVFFRDPHFAQEALHQLQTFQVIQPWQDCADLGPHGGISRHFRSFGYQHQRGIKKQTHPSQPYEYAHTGFAWCYRTSFWMQCQGLMTFPILGSADHHQAFAMIGEVDKTIHRGMAPSFFELCHEWQDRAMAITHGEVGFSVGRIEHAFHGPKNRRYYRERWQLLVDHCYDPKKHLMTDPQGVAYIVGNKKLEHAIIKYNRSRFEDSVEEF